MNKELKIWNSKVSSWKFDVFDCIENGGCEEEVFRTQKHIERSFNLCEEHKQRREELRKELGEIK